MGCSPGTIGAVTHARRMKLMLVAAITIIKQRTSVDAYNAGRMKRDEGLVPYERIANFAQRGLIR